MTITEIINALRCCADSSTGCSECPFVGKCIHTHADLKLAAVDVIQTLCGELATYHAKSIIDEKQIADLQKQVNEFIKNETHSSVIKAMSRRIEELEKQLPKESAWMMNIRWDYQQPSQSATIDVGTTFMCSSTGKPCQNATDYGYCKQTVCTNPARG